MRDGSLISPVDRQLIALLVDGRFHSGTELAGALGVSRSAVWKHLQGLSELGIEILAVSGKGYRLATPMDLLDSERIFAYLHHRASGLLTGLEVHGLIASTNTYLHELAEQGVPGGLVCLAERQTAGKGRRGRQWVSPFGRNIYLSILWRFQGGPAAIAGLSLALGVATIQALRQLGAHDVGLKWPNDIYWRQRKLGGILIEVSGESDGPCHAVAGLGLNVDMSAKQGEAIDQDWADLVAVLGGSARPDRNRVSGVLLNHWLPVLAEFEQRTLVDYIEDWREVDCMVGKTVDISIGNLEHRGTVAGIDDQGFLLLTDANGELRRFASGEVSFSKS
ncbi:bifunctional biotin--[acetyl-CoA-carboxylase] ligase/biotin operon repressor BirA [Methylomonas sp. MV1]|uniref:bifunctional biotin--[acetyl-CoA-carboxylase] ligase/biotin operon repressor BirA n=1 Tax=Methylomonas sp. MV1 TaxID=3073620 RepID=UPI0028A2F8AE|nr:bifunctional biotin--[acetyl-CoA-carboxylase] ligase/biotin operon repressor BirA [Methylomonas sp. MV1]MDT4328580.1 bifunctional biotin--[acetyl-CoA-carboxylase] ligase/biotin operon repressor BirA [Methylomonas sp. MV1]